VYGRLYIYHTTKTAKINKKLSWCWQTCATRLEVSQCHKHSTIPYVRYRFFLCNSNFVFKTRHFFDNQLQKMSWPWNPGHRSLKVIESGTIPQIAYDFLLMFYKNSVPKTPSFWLKTAVTLTTGLRVRQCHLKCHHAIQRIQLPMDVLW